MPCRQKTLLCSYDRANPAPSAAQELMRPHAVQSRPISGGLGLATRPARSAKLGCGVGGMPRAVWRGLHSLALNT